MNLTNAEIYLAVTVFIVSGYIFYWVGRAHGLYIEQKNKFKNDDDTI
jgi:hypothetical protein